MKLSQFILSNIEPIMNEWQSFAKALDPGRQMTVVALRNDAERMLRFIAANVETQQSAAQADDKAKGDGPQLAPEERSAAHDHGVQRLEYGFTMRDMVSEYRALRASITRLWLASAPAEASTIEQLVRFNEAVDQTLAESTDRYQKRLNHDHDLFLAVLGHDLRNPLHAVTMGAAVLKRLPGLPPKVGQVAERISESSTRMNRLVTDLLAFSRTRLGTVPLRPVECDIAEVTREVAAELMATDPGQRIAVTVEGNATGVWDRDRIAQLLSNLVGNALQHGQRGTEIAIDVRAADAHVDIFIKNQGAPIPQAERDAIFQPLRRGEHAFDKHGSLGLGLYVVREIATAHGGTVEVAASDENGTVFHVHLDRRSHTDGR